MRTNLALCFPDWTARQLKEVERAHFRMLAEMLAEVSHCWQWPGRLGAETGEVLGLEHLEAARSGGSGVLLATAHCTCLELGARLFGEAVAACGMYRPLRNPVLETLQNRGRQRYADGMFRRDDLRGIVRHLRAGGVLWYAPDQDLGPRRSAFAPLFGRPAATARAVVELARLGRARVVPMYPFKDPVGGRVQVILSPALEDFPSGDLVADLTRYNALVEEWIRHRPAQYWWLHRRFKTTPEGWTSPY